MDHTLHYINGEWVTSSSNNRIKVLNPATEKVITEVTLGTTADVDLAVSAAKKAFVSFALTTPQERIELLQSILHEMNEKAEALADVMTMEMGAPYTFSRLEQVASGIGHVETMIDVLKNYSFSQRKDNSLVVQEPVGVCGLITPWNWPLNQITCKVMPAIAAGCTMVLKPSELAPLSAMLFADILHKAGVLKGVFNLVNGDGAIVGSAISSHKDVDMVSITGSTKAGIAVAKNAATTVKRVHQELGGNSPNIILADTNLAQALISGLRSVFSNSGQSCDSPARILLPQAKMDEAIVIAKQLAESLMVGDPTSPNTDLGPLISKNHFDKVQSMIKLGMQEGQLVTGGLGLPAGLEKGYYCRPTVFANITPNMQIANLEIFGPVAVMIGYSSIVEAIEIANSVDYGLAAYVQTNDLVMARKIAKQLHTGTVQINYPKYNNRVPFGGYKQSGNGREYAEYGLHDFMEYKSIVGYY